MHAARCCHTTSSFVYRILCVCLQLEAWAKYDVALFPNLPMHGLNVHAQKYDEEGCSMAKLRDAVTECAEGPPAAVGSLY